MKICEFKKVEMSIHEVQSLWMVPNRLWLLVDDNLPNRNRAVFCNAFLDADKKLQLSNWVKYFLPRILGSSHFLQWKPPTTSIVSLRRFFFFGRFLVGALKKWVKYFRCTKKIQRIWDSSPFAEFPFFLVVTTFFLTLKGFSLNPPPSSQANPSARYSELGAKIPKGALLLGWYFFRFFQVDFGDCGDHQLIGEVGTWNDEQIEWNMLAFR